LLHMKKKTFHFLTVMFFLKVVLWEWQDYLS